MTFLNKLTIIKEINASIEQGFKTFCMDLFEYFLMDPLSIEHFKTII